MFSAASGEGVLELSLRYNRGEKHVRDRAMQRIIARELKNGRLLRYEDAFEEELLKDEEILNADIQGMQPSVHVPIHAASNPYEPPRSSPPMSNPRSSPPMSNPRSNPPTSNPSYMSEERSDENQSNCTSVHTHGVDEEELDEDEVFFRSLAIQMMFEKQMKAYEEKLGLLKTNGSTITSGSHTFRNVTNVTIVNISDSVAASKYVIGMSKSDMTKALADENAVP